MKYRDFIQGDTLKVAQSLVSISDFSKGKTAGIFDDIQNNDSEYIVLKNNRPTAVVLSMKTYAELAEKADQLDILLQQIEEHGLSDLIEFRVKEDRKRT